MPEVAAVRSEQDCSSAHADCRTAGHLQKWVCVYLWCVHVYAHIDATLTSMNQIVFKLPTFV